MIRHTFFAGNSPISVMDPDGGRKIKVNITINQKTGKITAHDTNTNEYILEKVAVHSTSSLSGDGTITYDYYNVLEVTTPYLAI